MNKQIIIVTRDLTIGGVGTHTQRLVEMFLADKYTIVLIAPNNIFGDNVNYHKINLVGKTFITRELVFFFSARRIINNLKLNEETIIGQFNFLNIGLPKSIMFRHFEHFGQLESLKQQNGLLEKFFGYIFHFLYQVLDYLSIIGAKKVIYVSNSTLKVAKKKYSKYNHKFIYLPNFIKLPETNKSLSLKRNSTFTLLYIGRLEPLKGIDALCEKLENNRNYLEKYLGNFKLIIIGDGVLRKKLDKFNFVECLGKIKHENISSYYELSDIFIFPSLYENSPTVILEAMQYGRLILGRNIGDVADMLGNDGVQLFNSDNEIIEKIVNLSNLGEDRTESIITKNRESIKKYKSENIFLEIKKIINEF